MSDRFESNTRTVTLLTLASRGTGDALICVGAGLLVIMVWRGDRADARSTPENSR